MTDWLMVIITAIYVVATIFICVFNGRSAKAANEQTEAARNQTKEMIDQFKAVNRPFVTIRFDIIRSGLLCFIIENEGPLPAHNVQVKINDDFLDNIDADDKSRLEELNDATFYLASHQKLTVCLGGQPSFVNISKVVAKFDISYDEFEEHTEIDLNQYKVLIVYNSPVEDISQHLKKIREEDKAFHKNFLKAMEKPSPVQHVIMHSLAEEDAVRFKLYKEICITPKLTAGQLAEKLGLEENYTFELLMELYRVDRLIAFTHHEMPATDSNAVWYRR